MYGRNVHSNDKLRGKSDIQSETNLKHMGYYTNNDRNDIINKNMHTIEHLFSIGLKGSLSAADYTYIQVKAGSGSRLFSYPLLKEKDAGEFYKHTDGGRNLDIVNDCYYKRDTVIKFG